MTRDRLLFIGYLLLVLLMTTWHQPWLHTGIIGACLLLAGNQGLRLAGRALLAVLLFSGGVSLGYWLFAWWQGVSPWDYLARLNLRVFSLTLLTFLMMQRVNIFRALDFSPGLSYLLIIASGQIQTLRELYRDFRLAWRSRELNSPGLIQQQRQVGALGSCLLDKSLVRSREVGLAMRSRGFFDGPA